jgi:hypothetical protein
VQEQSQSIIVSFVHLKSFPLLNDTLRTFSHSIVNNEHLWILIISQLVRVSSSSISEVSVHVYSRDLVCLFLKSITKCYFVDHYGSSHANHRGTTLGRTIRSTQVRRAHLAARHPRRRSQNTCLSMYKAESMFKVGKMGANDVSADDISRCHSLSRCCFHLRRLFM